MTRDNYSNGGVRYNYQRSPGPGSATPAQLGNWLASAERLPGYLTDEELMAIIERGEEKRGHKRINN